MGRGAPAAHCGDVTQTDHTTRAHTARFVSVCTSVCHLCLHILSEESCPAQPLSILRRLTYRLIRSASLTRAPGQLTAWQPDQLCLPSSALQHSLTCPLLAELRYPGLRRRPDPPYQPIVGPILCAVNLSRTAAYPVSTNSTLSAPSHAHNTPPSHAPLSCLGCAAAATTHAAAAPPPSPPPPARAAAALAPAARAAAALAAAAHGAATHSAPDPTFQAISAQTISCCAQTILLYQVTKDILRCRRTAGALPAPCPSPRRPLYPDNGTLSPEYSAIDIPGLPPPYAPRAAIPCLAPPA